MSYSLYAGNGSACRLNGASYKPVSAYDKMESFVFAGAELPPASADRILTYVSHKLAVRSDIGVHAMQQCLAGNKLHSRITLDEVKKLMSKARPLAARLREQRFSGYHAGQNKSGSKSIMPDTRKAAP